MLFTHKNGKCMEGMHWLSDLLLCISLLSRSCTLPILVTLNNYASPRTRSDWGGRGGDIVRHLHGGAIPKPDVSREHTGTFNPDLGALTTAGLGTELPVGLGRSSTPWAEKGKACSQKSSNHLELSHPWHVFSFLFIGF